MNRPQRPRRTMLYVSGAVQRHLEKSRTLPADSLIYDLHETVYPAHKDEARAAIAALIEGGGFRGQERVLRVNALGTHWLEDDLRAAVTLGFDAALIPRIESAEQVHEARALLDGVGGAEMPLMAMIESPLGMLRIEAIAAAEPRLNALILNTNSLAAELGIRLTPDRIGLLGHLSQAVLAGRAYDKAVIDGAHLNLREAQSCELSCRQGRDLGFDGKTVVHPVQLPYTNDAFSPRPKEVDKARRQVALLEAAHARGEAVATDDGHVLTEDVETAARMVIELDAVIRAHTGQAA